MKVVSFNLRCESAGDGINRFYFRREHVIDKLLAEAPDVVGFQEVTPEMHDYLREKLTGYALVGCGRGADYMDEHNPVAFRTDVFELIALDVSWLSPTPFAPGSRYDDQSPCPRVVTHTILRKWGERTPFHFYNTHLDHQSSSARVLGAKRLIDKCALDQETHAFPMLMTGDFNAYPDSAEIALLTGGLNDLTYDVGTTWHNWGRETPPRIDYIFSKGFARKGDCKLWTDRWGDMFLSDHHAVEIIVNRREDGAC